MQWLCRQEPRTSLNDLGELSQRFADTIADVFRCLPVCGFEKIARNCSEIGSLQG